MRVVVFLVLALIFPTYPFADENRNRFEDLSTLKLLADYVAIQEELKTRGISKSGNSLTGDLGEHIFMSAFGWLPAPRSQKGFDAASLHSKFQIKARRVSSLGGNEQLGAIRDLAGFDVLAAVLFDKEYRVIAASLIPVDVVKSHAKYSEYTNSYRLMYNAGLRAHPDVKDVTARLSSLDY